MAKIYSELKELADTIKIVDTHEHMRSEEIWVNEGSVDVLANLFENYVAGDLVSAGFPEESLLDLWGNKIPIKERWESIKTYWERSQYTGYGEAVKLNAKLIFGIDEINLEAMEKAQPILDALRKPGERLKLLKEKAGLDHIQVDNFIYACVPDKSGPEFFLYDINWADFCNGYPPIEILLKETGVEITSVETYRECLNTLFKNNQAHAIAVKSQHAYQRSLRWENREDVEIKSILDKVINNIELPEHERLAIGDWGFARGVEYSIEYNLPFKIHTGYYAGNSRMPTNRINPSLLCGLFKKYLKAKFVLMHTAYPYGDELIAITKHYPNVYSDLCWAWSIDPVSTQEFVRKFIHTVPTNKLFAYGGDTHWPTTAVGYTVQARNWLSKTFANEVELGDLSMKQAKEILLKITRENQYEVFDITGTRKSIQDSLKV